MKLIVTTEFRFERTPDGAIWTQSAFPYSFWKHYLEVFDTVCVVARALDVTIVAPTYERVDDNGVFFAAIPYYLGPLQFLRYFPKIRQAACSAIGPQDAVIMRVGSPIAAIIEPILYKAGRPYGLEVVGDPYDVFAPSAVIHPLRPFFRWWFSSQLRRQCSRAPATAYVTRRLLQCRYPPGCDAFSTHYSSVELGRADILSELPALKRNQQIHGFTTHDSGVVKPGSVFGAKPKDNDVVLEPVFRIVSVGSLAQLYKAPDVLLQAVAACVGQGLNLELILIGDGKFRSHLETTTAGLGLGDRVHFLGTLPAGQAVREQLDRADLFVLASKTEGLPRAMIEAMARGLPCIGSNVGGIPELLSPEDIVPPGNTMALARKISEVLADPQRMARMSARNLEIAREYCEEGLQSRRNAFYQYVRENTESWVRG